MSKTLRVSQWGVRHPEGRVERIDEKSANEGYMTAQEYAVIRAGAVGGKVVKRTITTEITKSDWVEQ